MYISNSPWKVGSRMVRLIPAFLLLSLMSCLTPTNAQDTGEAALKFVTTHRIGSNLSQMALVVASSTQTYQVLTQKLGPTEARKRVQEEIAAVVPTYQNQWDKHLASAYAKHFSAEELDSLRSEGPKSKYAGKLASMQKAVGADMRAASQPVLSEMLGRVLQNVLSGVAK
jgi:hypothetical protein